MKKWISLLLTLALGLSLSACGDPGAGVPGTADVDQPSTSVGTQPPEEKRPVMGVCIWAIEAEYFTNLAHWMEEAGRSHGWDVIVQSGDATNPSSQVEILENFITMDVDAVFINPINMDAVEDVLAKAQEKGIWIFGHNYRYEDSELPDIYLAGDPAEAGADIAVLADQEAQKVLGGGKVVAAALTNVTNENNTKRSQGMVAKAKELWGEDSIVAENSPNNVEEAMTAAENMVQANPDINVWICYNDECAIGVYQFYNASGRDQASAVIVGADGNKDVLEAIVQGTAVRGTLSQTLNVKCGLIFDAADVLMDSGDVKQAQELAGYEIFSPIDASNAQAELDAAAWQ